MRGNYRVAVRQYSIDGKLLAEFPSVSSAAESVVCTPGLIVKGCSRVPGVVTCKGFVWRYAHDDEIARGDLSGLPVGKPERKVRQYSLKGVLVKEFASLAVASDETGFSRNCISSCCRKSEHHITSHGFIWRYDDDDEIADGDLSSLSLYKEIDMRKAVRQYTVDGEFVAEYAGVRLAARETGLKNSSISNCCNRKPRYETTGGFKWRFVEDDELWKKSGEA